MRGFTLLELLVVLVVMGLLVALIPPMLSGAGVTTEVRGAARQLAAGLRAARSEAVTQQQPAVLSLDLQQREFIVTGRKRPVTLPQHPRVTIQLYTAQAEIVDEDRGHIRFFPDGSSTGGYIALSDQRVEYRVNVDWLTGRIRIEDRDAD
jgi:general secretion pathway protein H